ncbi:hypothetical protein [Ferrimonas pelagia]|uniref:PA14 domain-containing protein n=1 Tax=Ferrimonas pelagia TaxID=1177826 RepID=A0ABP9EDM6_9GAMM
MLKGIFVVAMFSFSALGLAETVNEAPKVYKKGLVADVYVEDAKSGTWANPGPTGVIIGSFVDAKPPLFSFGNIKQDDTAWSMFAGSHIGLKWSGYFKAEEVGDYVLMITRDVVKTNTYTNSCTFDISLSGSVISKAGFKHSKESSYWNRDDTMNTTTPLSLDKGYYPIEIWMHCGVTKSYWNEWVKDVDDITWTIKLKRPSDRMVQVASSSLFVWN